MKRRERNIDHYRITRTEVLNVCEGVVNANICKGNKRIIKDDKSQTLGISFSIPSGVATVGGGV